MAETRQASLLGLPYELREQILGYLFHREEGPFVVKGHEVLFQHHFQNRRRLVGERPRAFLLPDRNGLFSTQPIGLVNRQLRLEVSDLLRTVPVDIVTVVRKLDYNHIIDFLRSLPASRLTDFTVQPDIDVDYTRTLRIEIVCERDIKLLPNIYKWLDTISTLFGPDEELSTATSLSLQPKVERAPLSMLLKLYHRESAHPEGPAREELRKILVVFWARLRLEGLKITGVYKRDPLGTLGLIPFEAENDQFLSWLWLGF